MVTMVETQLDHRLTEFKFSLEESTEKIRRLSRHTVENVVQIGRELKWVKDHLEHGLWETWVREELEWHPATAWRFLDAARRHENLASTQELDEQSFIQELWGNVSKTGQPKSQEDVLKWLEREFDKLNHKACHLCSCLTFCDHLTPTIREKLRNLAQTLTNVAESGEPKVNINLN